MEGDQRASPPAEAQQLVVGGDELYVCDTNNHRLQVFSLTGEHRRSVTGEWRSPQYLCFAKDRLYLLEQSNGEAPVQGHRIFVLSLLGDILQVFTHPTEPSARFQSICCFDHKLLAGYTSNVTAAGMLALQGL